MEERIHEERKECKKLMICTFTVPGVFGFQQGSMGA